MNEFKTEFKYELQVPLAYASKGDEVHASHVIIKAPTMTVGAHTTTLEQAFSNAKDVALENAIKIIGREKVDSHLEQAETASKQKDEPKAEEFEQTAATIVEMLFRGKGDVNACFKALQSILTSMDSTRKPFCLVDGETQMTSLIWNSLSPVDAKGILGEYIRNFIIASPKH